MFDKIIAKAKQLLSFGRQEKFPQDLEKEIDSLRKEIQSNMAQVYELQSTYESLVDEYLEYHKPFPSKPKDTTSDFMQYLTLIKHSIIAGDFYLLKKWGVDYTRENPQLLADERANYARKFSTALIDRNLKISFEKEGVSFEILKEFLEYLSRELI